MDDPMDNVDPSVLVVTRAKQRLRLTTQLCQQIIPALPVIWMQAKTDEERKGATFVLSKVVLSEACRLVNGAENQGSLRREVRGVKNRERFDEEKGRVTDKKADESGNDIKHEPTRELKDISVESSEMNLRTEEGGADMGSGEGSQAADR